MFDCGTGCVLAGGFGTTRTPSRRAAARAATISRQSVCGQRAER